MLAVSSMIRPAVLDDSGDKLLVDVQMTDGNGVDVPDGFSLSSRRFGGSAGGDPCSNCSSFGRWPASDPSQNISIRSTRDIICLPAGITTLSVPSDGTGIGPNVCIYAWTV